MLRVVTLITILLIFINPVSRDLFYPNSPVVYAQTINTRFSTYFYTWQRYDSIGGNSKTTHLRGYQNMLFDVSLKKWSFNTNLQIEEDVFNRNARGFGYRFYNLYIKGTNLFNILDIKFGRQFVFAGAGKGSLDGGYFKLKLGKNKEYQITGYGGALTPLDYSFKSYPALNQNYMIGGQFRYYGIKDLMISASYYNKHRKPQPYYTIRADSLFNAKTIYIDIDSPADQVAGIDFDYALFKKYNFFGKAYYDLNLKKFLRGELYTRINPFKDLNISLGYNYHEPQLSYNTIFWVFDYKKFQEIEFGLDYLFKNRFNFYGRVSDIIYTDVSGWRFQFGVSSSFFGINYTKNTNYNGESDAVNGYFSYELLSDGKLSASLMLNYSNYKLSDYDDNKINSFSGLVGISYRPVKYLTLDLQGQFITNRIYKTDTRLLFGINYWMRHFLGDPTGHKTTNL